MQCTYCRDEATCKSIYNEPICDYEGCLEQSIAENTYDKKEEKDA